MPIRLRGQPFSAAAVRVPIPWVLTLHVGWLHAGMVTTVVGNVFRAAGLTDGIGSEALLTTGSLELHCDASGGIS